MSVKIIQTETQRKREKKVKQNGASKINGMLYNDLIYVKLESRKRDNIQNTAEISDEIMKENLNVWKLSNKLLNNQNKIQKTI